MKARKNGKKSYGGANYSKNEMSLDDEALDDNAFDGAAQDIDGLDNDDDADNQILPSPFCEEAFRTRHFIPKKCLQQMRGITTCNRCEDLKRRSQLQSHSRWLRG